jgi:hypothetical protein
MGSLSGPTEIVEPPVRHGKCRLHITIGGTCYALRPIPGQPRGVKVYCLRSLNGERAGMFYSVAIVNREAGCTCPDAEINGAVCKHIMALRAIGFLPISARTAAESKAETDRLGIARGRRRHSPATAGPLASPASPFVAGWNTAVSKHVTQLQGGRA